MPEQPDNPHLPPELAALCARHLGSPCTHAEAMPGGGSRRAFHRLTLADGRSAIGVAGQDLDEVRAFLVMTRHFAALGIPVAAIHGEDAGRGLYLMEDLGRRTLAAMLAEWSDGEAGRREARAALETVVRWLAAIQVRGGRALPPEVYLEGGALDGAVFRGDLQRFAAHFLPRYAPRAEPPRPGEPLGAELEALVARLDALPREHFCYRDFQGRNIMWVRRAGDDAPGPVFIDYQSGRPGAPAYDLASLLYSPDTRADEPLRAYLLEAYLAALADEGVRLTRDAFLEGFMPILLVRRMQALGAYAELGAERGKPGYLEQIPPAVTELRALLRAGRFELGLPTLERWLGEVLAEAEEG